MSEAQVEALLGRRAVAPALADGLVRARRPAGTDGAGEGNVEWPSGARYVGGFLRGQLHGAARLEWPDGAVYEGAVACNQLSGAGRLTWPDGSSYAGGFLEGERDGEGLLEHKASGVSYSGQWQRSLRHGRGRLQDGACWYEGEWRDGKRCGEGRMRFSNGDKYSGQWQDDVPHGSGTMVWGKKRERYIGQWLAGKQCGRGQYFWGEPEEAEPASPPMSPQQQQRAGAGGSPAPALPRALQCNHYDGEWLEGRRHGEGVFYYADGSRYRGSWEADRKSGRGVYTYADGRVYEGEFADDQLLGGEPDSVMGGASSIGVELHIDDMLPPFPKGRRMLREVENVLLRWNNQLRAVYAALQGLREAPCQPQSEQQHQHQHQQHQHQQQQEPQPHDDGVLFAVRTWQFWVLCRACGLLDAQVTLAAADRALAAVRASHGDRHSEEARAGGAAGIHAHDRTLLFREMVEAIVRLAHEKYAADEPDLSLAMLVSRAVTQNVVPFLELAPQRVEAATCAVAQPSTRLLSIFDAIAAEVDYQAADRVATPEAVLRQLALAGVLGKGRKMDVPGLVDEPEPVPEPPKEEPKVEAPPPQQHKADKGAKGAKGGKETKEPKADREAKDKADKASRRSTADPPAQVPDPDLLPAREKGVRLKLSHAAALGAIVQASVGQQPAGRPLPVQAMRAEIIACQLPAVIKTLAAAVIAAEPRLCIVTEELIVEELCQALLNPVVS
jgi:hypothetical protein